MNNAGEINSPRAKQKALATLGMDALERNKLDSVLDRAVDISCIILNLDCTVIFSLNNKGGTL